MAQDRKRYRSYEWFGKPDRDSMVHRSWMKNQGLPHHLFDGRPVIGICNTWSEADAVQRAFPRPRRARQARRARGRRLSRSSFPVMSLGETVMRPTAMLFRNLASWTWRSRSAPIRSTAWCC